MLSVLADAIRALPQLLETPEDWHSLDITYHPPRVERLWTQWGEYRILLHVIHPCDDGEALFHPHPWPSAMYIVNGQYEMKVAAQIGDAIPSLREDAIRGETLTRALFGKGSQYEMVEPKGWHSVRPLNGPAYSIMVIGPLYEPRVVMPHVPMDKQQPLCPKRFDELFSEWKEWCADNIVICPACGASTVEKLLQGEEWLEPYCFNCEADYQ